MICFIAKLRQSSNERAAHTTTAPSTAQSLKHTGCFSFFTGHQQLQAGPCF